MLLRRLNPVPYLKRKAWNAYNTRVERVKARLDLITVPKRFQGTIIEKWAKYWKYLVIDYSAVVGGILKDAKNRPVRAMLIAGTGSVVYHCAVRNPTYEDYQQALRSFSLDIAALPDNMQNTTSKNYLISVERMLSSGQLRRLDIGVASFIWRHHSNPELKTYQANCTFVQPELATFKDRIVEVGFLDRFWTLEKMMRDYDVNE